MEQRHKNMLIGGLLAIVLIMAVGYAAFATQLNINGTANITSNWDIHIESITPGEPVGNAKNITTSVAEGKLSAEFKTELVAPGDSITYTVVVKNDGNLDAKLNSIDFNKGTNSVIQYSYTGIDTTGETSLLPAGRERTFTITVAYNSAITSQPGQDDLQSTLTMQLNYVQNIVESTE